MAKKGVLGNGTGIWILHGAVPTLTKLGCVTEFVFGDDTFADVDNTCLEETEVRTSEDGLSTPGDGSFKINTDPTNATHVMLLDLADRKEIIGIYMGWNDGVGVPTLTGSTVDLPETRTWSWCEAKLRKNSVVVGLDALNNHTVPFKRQTKVTDEFKVTP